MTTTVKVQCNGDYVAMVEIDGVDAGTVGPGSMVEKTFNFLYDGRGHTYRVTERAATPEEISAANPRQKGPSR